MKKILLFLVFFYYATAIAQSAKLHTEEVEVLRQIAEKLRFAGWDFSKDPCGENYLRPRDWDMYVSCNCSFESNTTCRVTTIYISTADVSAPLPSEFAKLVYLQDLELSFSHFIGSIPSEWAVMHLTNLSINGNMLSGPFPLALTRITTLLELNMEGNRFSGPIPEEIANMKNLRKLY